MRARPSSSANIYLYSFLGLLFLFAVSVDVAGLADRAVANHEQATDQWVNSAFR